MFSNPNPSPGGGGGPDIGLPTGRPGGPPGGIGAVPVPPPLPGMVGGAIPVPPPMLSRVGGGPSPATLDSTTAAMLQAALQQGAGLMGSAVTQPGVLHPLSASGLPPRAIPSSTGMVSPNITGSSVDPSILAAMMSSLTGGKPGGGLMPPQAAAGPAGFVPGGVSPLLNLVGGLTPEQLFQWQGMQATAPAAAETVETKQQDGTGGPSQWKEHRTSEGRVFWHNAKTNKSTWDKPDELRSDMERILATSTSWREYPGASENDASYWHNLDTKISEWECPAEVQQLIDSVKELTAEDWSGKTYSGKSEAKQEFRKYLERKAIGQKAKWDDVGKLLQSDPKWKTFDKWMTSGERKHAFNEFVNQLQKKNRDEQRRKKGEARDALSEFLAKWRDGVDMAPMPPDATYELFEEEAGRLEWFHLLAVQDKAEAFEEMAGAVADDCMHRPSRAHQGEIRQFLEDLSEVEFPVLETNPRKIIETVQRACLVRPMPHPSVILSFWQVRVEDYIDRRRKRASQQFFRQERKNRDAFRQLLRDAEAAGTLDAKTEYRNFLEGPPPPKRPRKKSASSDDGEARNLQQSPPGTAAPDAEPESKKPEERPSAPTDSAAAMKSLRTPIEPIVAAITQERRQLVVKLREKITGAAAPSKPPSSEGPKPSTEDTGSSRVATDQSMGDGQATAEESVPPPGATLEKDRAYEEEDSDEERDGPPTAASVQTDSRYLRLFLQGGSTPKEMFESYVDALWDDYEMVRPIFKKALKNPKFVDAVLAIDLTAGDVDQVTNKESAAAVLPKQAQKAEGGVEAEEEEATSQGGGEKPAELQQQKKAPFIHLQFRRIVEDQWDSIPGLDAKLWSIADRPGVLVPLAASMIKRAANYAPTSSSFKDEEDNTRRHAEEFDEDGDSKPARGLSARTEDPGDD